MNIGITGATGFLGSYFIKYLLKNPDYKIWAFTRKACDSSHENLEFITGDLTSEYNCEQLIKNIDILVHLAHTNSPLNSNNDILSDTTLNIIPNLTLLETIKRQKKKIHVVYISSGGAIYGDSLKKIPFKETDILIPSSSYAIQKLAIENYLKLWSDYNYISSVILRLANPYGILLPSKRKQGLIGVALSKILKNETLQIFGNAENIRDYIHLDDMCKAFEAAILYKTDYEIFNIGSGKGQSVNKILDLVEKYTKLTFKKEHDNDENSKKLVGWNILDITKAKKYLNWSPEIQFKDGLKLLCEEGIKKYNHE